MPRQESDWTEERRDMVGRQLRRRGIRDERVLAAFLSVPRHQFVPAAYRDQAYEDHPVAIDFGQTISQPYMVALMTEALEVRGGERVLEIGTGSGYQTAILAELAAEVFSVERIPELSERARQTLERLAYTTVHFHIGDGTLGWPEEAPFDRILVTAGAPRVPESLESQLADDGYLVIPVGGRGGQDLLRVHRCGEEVHRESLGGCIFVRLIGEQGWPES